MADRTCARCGSPQVVEGATLYGFCGGHFGRDSYSDKTVLHVGPDYVVAREDGGLVVLAGGDPDRLKPYLNQERTTGE